MKILYITPKINNEGGVARVLSIKTNYLIEKLGYEVSIITQNSGNSPLFFNFNQNVNLYDITLRSNRLQFLIDYRKQVLKIIKDLNPRVIVVSDNGLKGFLFPLVIKTKIPIVFEVHGSKYNEEFNFDNAFTTKFFHHLKYKIRNYGASKFDYFVALSKESALEWNLKNTTIIPNAVEKFSNSVAKLESKTVLFVGRHSYEKGLDRLLNIWKIVSEKHADWRLEIYGKSDDGKHYFELCKELKLENNTFFYEPITTIHEKYLEASIYVMTSRHEGFPMVLLEAMNAGLPIVAFDCPIGPRSILTNSEDGFLIEDNNLEAFALKLQLLMEDSSLRMKMGENAKKNIAIYNLEKVMKKWQLFFESVKN